MAEIKQNIEEEKNQSEIANNVPSEQLIVLAQNDQQINDQQNKENSADNNSNGFGEFDKYLQQIDNIVTVSSKTENTQKQINTEKNNSDTSSTQNSTTNNSFVNDGLKVRIVNKNSLDADVNASLRNPVSGSAQVRIVEKNDSETDVIASLRDSEIDYRISEPVKKYDANVVNKPKEIVEVEEVVTTIKPTMSISSVMIEEGTRAIFNVTFDKASQAPYKVTFATTINSSAEAEDINSLLVVKDLRGNIISKNSDGSYTVPAGETSLKVEVQTINDDTFEGNEQFGLVGKTEFMSSNVQGTGTIVDDGSLSNGNNDDRPLSVNNVDVNEGSPYCVFTVTGASGQKASLSLSNQNSDGSNLTSLEYFNGTSWLSYGSGNVFLDNTGKLLVRVALSPEQETLFDGPETFKLVATNTGGKTASGIGKILDDGTGSYFAPDNNTDISNVPNNVTLDNDIPTLSINSINVTEGDYAIFTVSLSKESIENITFNLTSSNVEATTANDYTATYQVSTNNGTTWGSNVTSATITAGTTSILVRIPTTEDTVSEIDETFKLNAVVTSGTTTNNNTLTSGVATIIDDDNPNHAPTAANKTITTPEDTPILLTQTDFGFTDTDSDDLVSVKITTLENNGALQYFNGSNWIDVTLNQVITKADIDDGKLKFNPDLNENGNTYTTFQFTVNDGTTNSTTPNTITFNVTPVNDASILDLDSNNSTITGSNYLTSYALGKTAVSIGDIDVGITDIDDTNIESAIITLTNAKAGDLLFASNLPTGISVDNTSTSSLIKLIGSATKSDYEKAIEAIKFYNANTSADKSDRAITVVINDGTTDSNTATTTIKVATNALNITTNPTVEEGKSAIFSVSLEDARNTDTKIYLITSGNSTSGSDYNSQIMYESAPGVWSNVQNDGGGNFITIPTGQTSVDVKIKTISENPINSDDGENLVLIGTISGTATDLANTISSASTIITELPSLIISAPNYAIEGNSAIFEIGLTKTKTSSTTINLSVSGDVTSSDYSNLQYSTDGINWTNISNNQIILPLNTTTPPSIYVKATITSNDGADNLESLVLNATTSDSGISPYGNSVSDNTVVIEPLSLNVTEKKDGIEITNTTSVTTSLDANYTYVKVSDGKNGIVVENINGTLTYTPNTDFSGSDSFSYLMINQTTGETITSIANVTVTAVADTPDVEISITNFVAENVIDDTVWLKNTSNGASLSQVSNVGTAIDISSATVTLNNGDYIINTFTAPTGTQMTVSYTQTTSGSPSLIMKWGTLSSDKTTVTNLQDVVISGGYAIVPSGADVIFIRNNKTGGASSITLSNIELTSYVSASEKSFNVDIYNALTDTDNQTTGIVNKEELQSVTLQVKDSSNTLIASSGFFNQGTYDSTTKTWTFTQAQLDSLKVTVSSTLATNGFKLEATATSKELSNNNTATKTATISIIDSDDRPTIGDQTLSVSNAQASTNGTNIDTDYSSNTPNVFSWDPSKSSIPELYANGQKVVITYDNATHTVKGTIDNGATTIFTTTITMADNNGTTLNYTQGNKLLGVVNMIDGDIILPGGGNQDYRIFQFTDSNSSTVVDALVSAHNLIEDSVSDLSDGDAEHTVNTNNYYIGVDSNNMNAGQQLVFDFNRVATYDGITTHANEVSEINIKLFNFGSEKSGDELFITVITKGNIREQILLTQDSDYTTELEYTVRSATGNPIIGVEFLAGNNSSFKLGIASIGSVSYDDTFEMKFAYDISDVDGDSDSGLTTIKVGSGTVNTSLDYELDSKIVYDSSDKVIDGGAGIDTLILSTGINIDFATYTNDINNIEKIDLTQNGNHSLTNIALQDVIDITDSSNLLSILGESGDSVTLDTENGNTWSTNNAIDSEGFKTYTNTGNNTVSLKVDSDIQVSII